MSAPLAVTAVPVEAATAAAVPHLLVAHAPVVGGRDAPLAVTVRTPRGASLALWVNGRRVTAGFHRVGPALRRAELARRDGLRPGANHIRIRARRAGGHGGDHDTERLTVRLTAVQLLADAGPDAHGVLPDRPVRVGTTVPRAGRGSAEAVHRWRIVRAPRGSRAALRGARTATPTLRADRAGTYRLRLTATTAAAGAATSSRDAVDIRLRPPDPPIGVALRTLAPDREMIVFGDDWAPYTAGRDTIGIAVFDRATRELLQSGERPRTTGGIAELRSIVGRYAATSDRLVVLSGRAGAGGTAQADALADLLVALGADRPDAATRTALANGRPFSAVGNPGAGPGNGFARLPTTDVTDSGEITGYLQRNPGTDRYDFVSPEHPSYDTAVEPATSGRGTMRYGRSTYAADLPSGVSAGFHIVALDSRTGALVANEALATDGTGDDRAAQLAAGTRVGTLADQAGHPLVLLQSIGAPRGTSDGWNALAAAVRRLGGDPRVLNGMNGTTDSYALVGRVDSDGPAAEASTVSGTLGRLTGSVARTRTFHLETVSADPGYTNTELIDLAYQPATPFPPFAAGGPAAAARYLATKAKLCTATDASCDIRARYWSSYGANWHQRYQLLANADYPAGTADARAFTEAQFDAVQDQLGDELAALNTVKTYVARLQAPFGGAGTRAQVDLAKIADEVREAVKPPPAGIAGSTILSFISYDLLGAGKLVGFRADTKVRPVPTRLVVARALGTFAAVFALAAHLARTDGKPLLDGTIDARADRLAGEVLDRYDAASDAIGALGPLIASDYGKLMSAAAHMDDDWALPASDGATDAVIRTGSRAWFYRTLVPLAYPRFVQGWGKSPAPPAVDPHDPYGPWPSRPYEPLRANDIECGRPVANDRPFKGQIPDAQLNAIVGFEPDGTAIRSNSLFVGPEDASPRPELLRAMLRPVDVADPGLGMSPFELITAANFPDRLQLTTPYHIGCTS